MPVVGALPKPFGKASKYKIFAGTASITGTGDIETGLSNIVAAVVTPEESTSGLQVTVKITSISGGKISVEVATYDGTTFTAPATSAVKVHVIAVGY